MINSGIGCNCENCTAFGFQNIFYGRHKLSFQRVNKNSLLLKIGIFGQN
jgi:hypothetical protein